MSMRRKIVGLFESAAVIHELDEVRQGVVDDFLGFCQEKLEIQEMPELILVPHKGPDMSTAAYSPTYNSMQILSGGRALVDVLRSIAHELVHRQQDEQGRLQGAEGPGADNRQDIGADYENEANAVGGALIKEFSRFYDGLPKDKIYEL